MASCTMPIKDVGELVNALENAGELKRISAQVDPDLEIAEILRRTMYAKGPAILFENVKGYDMPVLGNAFGSEKMLQIGLEMEDFTEIGSRIVDMTRMDIPSSTIGKLKKLPELSKMGGAFPKLEKSGPVTFLTEDEPSFSKIPILKSWPNDAGKFITLGLVATKHPETKVRNLGVYRIQILDDTHALMHWQKHKRGAQHAQMNKGKTEVAIIIGADPAQTKPKGTMPKGFTPESASKPKPAETKNAPTNMAQALEKAYENWPMTSTADYKAKTPGYTPAPNRYFARQHGVVGKTTTKDWNIQKKAVTGYTAASDQYFATKQRLAYHPADKTFNGYGLKANGSAQQAPPPPPPPPKVETKPAPAPAKSKGTMPKGFNAESAPKPAPAG